VVEHDTREIETSISGAWNPRLAPVMTRDGSEITPDSSEISPARQDPRWASIFRSGATRDATIIWDLIKFEDPREERNEPSHSSLPDERFFHALPNIVKDGLTV
jgi:hypothetical protein